jgi:predicted RNase H-like HicB family nuclease
MYRLGFPGWKLAAKFGVPIMFTVKVVYDDESKVYVATSPELEGLVVEASSKEEMISEVYDCAEMLLSVKLKHEPKKKPFAAWDGNFALA